MSADGSDAPHRGLITFFEDQFARTKREEILTLDELAARIRGTHAKDKGLLPWFKLARFGDEASDKGCLRHDRNVISISGAVGDYDGEIIPFQAAVATVRAAHVRAILYTTPSHSEAKPHWRIACSTAREWPPNYHSKFIARINGLIDGKLAPESETLSQSYYFGSVEGHEVCEVALVEGKPIDERDDLDAKAVSSKDKKKKEPGETDHPRGRGFEAHIASMGDGEGRDGFNFPICRAAGAYAVQHGPDLDRSALKGKLIAAIKAAPKSPERAHKPNNLEYYLSNAYLDRAIATAIEKYGDTRPREFAKAKKLSDEDFVFIEAQAAIGAVDYARGRKTAAKQLNIGVTALDKLVQEYRDATSEPDEAATSTQADVLLSIAQDAKLFHTSEGVAYADIMVNGHRETWPVASKGFKDWLTREYYAKAHAAPGSYGMDAALGFIGAKAQFDATTQEVFLRTARLDGKIYLDLCDDDWRAVEIDEDGWRIVAASAAHFRRARGMLPLPEPKHGGSIVDLRPFINMPEPKYTTDPSTGEEKIVPGTDDDFVLTVGWQVGTLSGVGPYAVLALGGSHGAAKTFSGRVIRETIDPNKVSQRALPRHDHDLYIAGGNALILAFDNISTLPDWLSDTLCRLSTGGGFAARELYTDADEKLFDGMRPLMLNGIENFITRPDLGDRTIVMMLEEIPDKKRRTEAELWAEFEKARPKILGALLDAVAHGLKAMASTKLTELPRMADFALWVAACEGAFGWEPGTFERAYRENRKSGQVEMLDTDMLAAVVRKLAANPPRVDGESEAGFQKRIAASEGIMWEGTATELLDRITSYATVEIQRDRRWPRTPRQLGGRLRRMMKPLRLVGVEVAFDRSHNSKITITRKVV